MVSNYELARVLAVYEYVYDLACMHAVTLSKNDNNWATINKLILCRDTDGGVGGGMC